MATRLIPELWGYSQLTYKHPRTTLQYTITLQEKENILNKLTGTTICGVIFLVCYCNAFAQSQTLDAGLAGDFGPMEIGNGWESELGLQRLQCVQLKAGEKTPQRGESLQSTLDIDTYSSSREVIESYSRNARVSYNQAGSGRSNSIREGKVTNYQSYASLVNKVEIMLKKT